MNNLLNNLYTNGCSFTYGSELLDPELDHSWDRHHENTPYREKYCWLGRLAERLSCKAINLSEPSCSNYAIQEKFADYIFRTYTEDTIIAVGWTSHLRMSWWDEDKSWIHDGNIRYNAEELFNKTFKEWVTHSYKRCEHVTRNAKMFINAVCDSKNIRLIQFDALSNSKSINNNFHQKGRNMQDVLRAEGNRLDKEFLAPEGHPNEAGHEYYAKLLHAWIKANKII